MLRCGGGWSHCGQEFNTVVSRVLSVGEKGAGLSKKARKYAPNLDDRSPAIVTTPAFDLGSLPPKIVLTIARCMDISTLSSLIRTCQSLRTHLNRVLDKRKLSSELITAVDQSKPEAVQRLLAAAANPDTQKAGCPILHIAARSRYVGHKSSSSDIVRFLLESGCDSNSRDQNGYTALYLATISGSSDKVRWLLETAKSLSHQLHPHPADPNATNTEMLWTPLHYATYACDLKLVTLLCRNGANPNKQDATGGTPLHILRRYCHNQCAQIDSRALLSLRIRDKLREFGADPDAEDFLGLKPGSYHFNKNRREFFKIVGYDLASFLFGTE